MSSRLRRENFLIHVHIKEDGRREKPAEAFVGSFLVDSHHIHELETCTLQVNGKLGC